MNHKIAIIVDLHLAQMVDITECLDSLQHIVSITVPYNSQSVQDGRKQHLDTACKLSL